MAFNTENTKNIKIPLNSKEEKVYAIFLLLEQQYCHPSHSGVTLCFFFRFFKVVSLCLFSASAGETEAAIFAGVRKADQAISQIKPLVAVMQRTLGKV